MGAATLERINSLASEREQLFRMAGNGAATVTGRGRITDIGRELEGLWASRRNQMAGRRHGIDLLIEQEYERIYGSDFEDAVTPATVGEPEDGPVTLVA